MVLKRERDYFQTGIRSDCRMQWSQRAVQWSGCSDGISEHYMSKRQNINADDRCLGDKVCSFFTTFAVDYGLLTVAPQCHVREVT